MHSNSATAEKIEEQPRQVACERCGFKIFDGLVFRSRVIRIRPDARCEAKCRCKHWQPVPLRHTPA